MKIYVIILSVLILNFKPLTIYNLNKNGNKQYKEKKYKSAIANYKEALNIEENIIISRNLSKSNYQNENFEKVIEFEGKNFYDYFNRGNAYKKLGDKNKDISYYEKALEEYKKGISLNEKNMDIKKNYEIVKKLLENQNDDNLNNDENKNGDDNKNTDNNKESNDSEQNSNDRSNSDSSDNEEDLEKNKQNDNKNSNNDNEEGSDNEKDKNSNKESTSDGEQSNAEKNNNEVNNGRDNLGVNEELDEALYHLKKLEIQEKNSLKESSGRKPTPYEEKSKRW